LLRTALAAALVLACGLLLMRLLVEFRPEVATIVTTGLPVEAVPSSGPIPLSGAESGACMSYPATNGRSSKTVFIDAGHGGIDPGVVGSAGARQVLEKMALWRSPTG